MRGKVVLRVAKKPVSGHFDGNLQKDIQFWFWNDFDKLDDEDFAALAAAKRLDWVIFPLKESREAG